MYGICSETGQYFIGIYEKTAVFPRFFQANLLTFLRAWYNCITFESEPDFAKVPIPIIALAGGKEPKEVMDSVKRMAEINPNCRCEIWDKAAHNIPPMFAKRFNQLILDTVQ